MLYNYVNFIVAVDKNFGIEQGIQDDDSDSDSEEDVYYSAPNSFFSEDFFDSLSDFPVTGL